MYSYHYKGQVSHYFSEQCRSLDLPFSDVQISEIFFSHVRLKAHWYGLPQTRGLLASKINWSPQLIKHKTSKYLACYSPCSHKQLDTTERLNNIKKKKQLSSLMFQTLIGLTQSPLPCYTYNVIQKPKSGFRCSVAICISCNSEEFHLRQQPLYI